MAALPYPDWYAFIRKRLNSSHPVLELFAGPAQMAKFARNEGISAFALDIHLPFLKKQVGYHLVADASEIPFKTASLGTLVATNSGLNYLENRALLEKHFTDCRRVLVDDGCYVFDVCTPGRAQELHDTTQTALAGKVTFTHFYDASSQVLETNVTIHEQQISQELHLQSIFTTETITLAAGAAGFSVTERVENYALPLRGKLRPIETWVLAASNNRAR